jgi:hypothetical protein
MKKLLLFGIILFLGGCEIYLFEDPYVDERNQFVGSYHVDEYSQITEQHYTYSMTIRKSCCNSREVKISNFYGVGISVKAIVNNNRLTIPLQMAGGYEIDGTGKMSYNKLSLTYVVRDLNGIPVFTDFVDAEGRFY